MTNGVNVQDIPISDWKDAQLTIGTEVSKRGVYAMNLMGAQGLATQLPPGMSHAIYDQLLKDIKAGKAYHLYNARQKQALRHLLQGINSPNMKARQAAGHAHSLLNKMDIIMSSFRISDFDVFLNGIEGQTESLLAPYITEHVGGFVGDSIKQNFFTLGMTGTGRWSSLTPGTLENKRKKLEAATGQVVQINRPLHGRSFIPTLPEGWEAFLYQNGWGRWGKRRGYGTEGYDVGGMAKMARPKDAIGRKYGTAAMPILRSGGPQFQAHTAPEFKYWYGKTYDDRTGKTPSILKSPGRRRPIIDITATLMPMAYLSEGKSYHSDGFTDVARGNPTDGKISVTGAIEPYMTQAPEIFLHEQGNPSGRLPKRDFIAHGIWKGLEMGRALGKSYVDKTVEQAYMSHTRYDAAMRMEVQKMFRELDVSVGAGQKKIQGKQGLKKMPKYAAYSEFDSPFKLQEEKGLMQKLMASRNVWWVLPPSKYWHYIGAAFDIKSLLTGGFFNLGAVQAYIKAMTVGLLGARSGSPMPFTYKAQRRKFRKGLYTRAGYHRKG